MRYTEPRYTKDIDLWVDPEPTNAGRVYRALAAFGAPLTEFSPKDFADRYSVFQIGVEPVRIDVITSLAGISFAAAWRHRTSANVEGQRVNFISRSDLIRSKRKAGRRQDLIDLDGLEGRS